MVTFGTMFGSRLAGLADPAGLTADHKRPTAEDAIGFRWTRMVCINRGSVGHKVKSVRLAVRECQTSDFQRMIEGWGWSNPRR